MEKLIFEGRPPVQFRICAVLVLFSCTLFGQAHDVACTSPETAKACKSFKELVSAGDKDIIDALKKQNSYICFEEKEDIFFVIAYDNPKPYWDKSKDGNWQEQFAGVTFDRYKSGTNDPGGMAFFAVGKWTRVSPEQAASYTGHSLNKTAYPKAEMLIDESEIGVGNSFENLNGSTTSYSLTIRKSTGRFTETFESSIGSTPSRSEDSGKCITYKKTGKP